MRYYSISTLADWGQTRHDGRSRHSEFERLQTRKRCKGRNTNTKLSAVQKLDCGAGTKRAARHKKRRLHQMRCKQRVNAKRNRCKARKSHANQKRCVSQWTAFLVFSLTACAVAVCIVFGPSQPPSGRESDWKWKIIFSVTFLPTIQRIPAGQRVCRRLS